MVCAVVTYVVRKFSPPHTIYKVCRIRYFRMAYVYGKYVAYDFFVRRTITKSMLDTIFSYGVLFELVCDIRFYFTWHTFYIRM